MANARRKHHSLLLPLAGAVTAAAAAYTLYTLFTSRRVAAAAAAAPSASPQTIVFAVRESRDLSALLRVIPTPLPRHLNLLVLVYAPEMREHPLSGGEAGRVYLQACGMLPRGTPREVVLPFTVRGDVVPMLKSLAPRVVYVEAGLMEVGEVRAVVDGGWVGEVVVVEERPEERGEWGRRCTVVDLMDVEEDWEARVLG